MKKGYVVQEVGYEYNDEYFYRGESGGGIAKFVFFTPEKAQSKIYELIADLVQNGDKDWRGKPIGYRPFTFCDNGDGIEFDTRAVEKLNVALGQMVEGKSFDYDEDDYDFMDWQLPTGLNSEQSMIIAKILIDDFKIVLYEVVEVEVEE